MIQVWRQPQAVFVLLMAIFFGVIWLVDAPLQTLLEFDREAIGQGQVWRLITANFTHFTLYHLAMNALGLVVVGVLLWPGERWGLLMVTTFVICASVGLGLYVFAGQTHIYRGFSGVLWGLVALGLLLNLRKDPWLARVGLVLLAGKIAYEQLPIFDPNYLADSFGAAIASEAHLVGVVSAVGCFGLFELVCWYKKDGSKT